MSRSSNFDDDEEFPVLSEVVTKKATQDTEANRPAYQAIQKPLSPKLDTPPPNRIANARNAACQNPHPPVERHNSNDVSLSIEQRINVIIHRHAEKMRRELLDVLKQRS